MQYVSTKAPVSGTATGKGGSATLANASFKVVGGKRYSGQLPLASFVTDDQGGFFLELPVGTYCIVEQERPEAFTLKKSTAAQKWDNRCRKKLWQTPLLVLELRSTEAMKITLVRELPDEHACLKK